LPAETDESRSLLDHAKLRAWRDQADRTREQVCVDTGLSFNYLQRLENGQARHPTLAVIGRLAAYYGHDPGELLLPAEAAATDD
jgi:transcriptional regulator with XRE-family HTH domain